MKTDRRYNEKVNTCIECNKDFHPIYNRLDSKYCSKKCYLLHRWGPKKAPNNCLVCNEPCISTGGRKQKYCSAGCRNIGQKGKPNIKGRNRKTRICDWCGKKVIRPASDFHSEKTFCNYECMARWQSKNIIGENHPKWKGGHPKTYGLGWKDARRKAIKRNNGICEHCNKKNSKDVHHKLPVRYFENKEDAHFASNLIAVCQQCHANLHKELEKSLPLLDLLQSSYQKENPI